MLAQTNDGNRGAIMDAAFREVYGRDATVFEMLGWQPQIKKQTAWYATIVPALIKNLNADKTTRQDRLGLAFRLVYGRNIQEGELNYWMPRADHFRLVIQSNRNLIYQPKDPGQLKDIVTRALKYKTGKLPTDAETQTAMSQFAINKKIYAEMIK